MEDLIGKYIAQEILIIYYCPFMPAKLTCSFLSCLDQGHVIRTKAKSKMAMTSWNSG